MKRRRIQKRQIAYLNDGQTPAFFSYSNTKSGYEYESFCGTHCNWDYWQLEACGDNSQVL